MLAGVRVVELATVVAAPTAASLLSDMGADVIKVEPPEGDTWRTQIGYNPKLKKDVRGEPFSSTFENANRGKRSVVLDLKSKGGIDTMKQLLHTADVFVTNVRTPALRKLGLHYDLIKDSYPRLVYAHLTAWGVGGPKEEDAGYDVGSFWAASGMQKFIMPDDEPTTGTPRFIGAVGDHVTAVHLLGGVLGALYHRERTGQAQYVEACIHRAGVHAMAVPMIGALAGAARGQPLKAPVREQYNNPTFNVFKCRDGRWIQLLGLETSRHMGKLLRCLELEEVVANDSRFAPLGQQYRDLVSALVRSAETRRDFCRLLDSAFSKKDLQDWEPIFQAADVWHHRMSDVNEVVTAENSNAVGAFVDVPGVGHKLLAHPIRWSAAPAAPKGRAPLLGAHTEEVLSELRSKL